MFGVFSSKKAPVTSSVAAPAPAKKSMFSGIKTLISGDPYNKFFENTQNVIETFKNNTDDNASVSVVPNQNITIAELKEKYKKYVLSDYIFLFFRYIFEEYKKEKSDEIIELYETIDVDKIIKPDKPSNKKQTLPLKNIKNEKMIIFSDNFLLYIYFKVSTQSTHYSYIARVYDGENNGFYLFIDIKDRLFNYINEKYPYMNFIIEDLKNKKFYKNPYLSKCDNINCKKETFYITEKGLSGDFPKNKIYGKHYTNGENYHTLEALHRIVSLDVTNKKDYRYFYDGARKVHNFYIADGPYVVNEDYLRSGTNFSRWVPYFLAGAKVINKATDKPDNSEVIDKSGGKKQKRRTLRKNHSRKTARMRRSRRAH